MGKGEEKLELSLSWLHVSVAPFSAGRINNNDCSFRNQALLEIEWIFLRKYLGKKYKVIFQLFILREIFCHAERC